MSEGGRDVAGLVCGDKTPSLKPSVTPSVLVDDHVSFFTAIIFRKDENELNFIWGGVGILILRLKFLLLTHRGIYGGHLSC